MKYLIVGLGNIGSEYVDTRHNIGFMVADRLVQHFNVVPELQRHAYVAQGKHRGRQIHIVMPTTYMNLSGKAVRYYMDKLKVSAENVLIVTDELALPFGTLRMKGKGSDGGHNGLKHIQQMLGTNKYPRLRFGIGNDFHKGQQVDYVLSPFSDEEFDALPALLDKCVDGILSFASIGIDRTMNSFNTRKAKKPPKKKEESESAEKE